MRVPGLGALTVPPSSGSGSGGTGIDSAVPCGRLRASERGMFANGSGVGDSKTPVAMAVKVPPPTTAAPAAVPPASRMKRLRPTSARLFPAMNQVPPRASIVRYVELT
jgi:hypothetical protein